MAVVLIAVLSVSAEPTCFEATREAPGVPRRTCRIATPFRGFPHLAGTIKSNRCLERSMGMHRFVALAAVCIGVCLAGSAAAEKSAITTTAKGHDLEVVVHGVTDYCSTNAGTEIIRRGDSIRIIRDRPSKVSRCMS